MSVSRRTLARAAAAVSLSSALVGAPALAAGAPRVKFVTSEGDFVIEVYPDKAPKTVENFLQYVKDKFYDGTIFHRVIKNFMVQGGGFDKDYKQKPTRPAIVHEGRESVAKGLHNTVGMVAMARTGDPNSATAQFFINVVDNSRLDPVIIPPGDPVPHFEYMGQTYENVPRKNLVNHPQLFGYTVFGKVVSGMDTVEKIRNTPTGAGGPFPTDVPQKPIVIESARVVSP
ncbi:MAG: peptidylprolyl isomerase, partial [Ottowia sp.]|nr:peptidylprolyl isomerase [Ottowia sp.]